MANHITPPWDDKTTECYGCPNHTEENCKKCNGIPTIAEISEAEDRWEDTVSAYNPSCYW